MRSWTAIPVMGVVAPLLLAGAEECQMLLSEAEQRDQPILPRESEGQAAPRTPVPDRLVTA